MDAESLKSVGIKSQTINESTFESEVHFLGCFIKSSDMDELSVAIVSAKKLGLGFYVFSDLPLVGIQNLKPLKTPLREVLPVFFSDLLPKKLKDLCTFAVSSIIPNLIPDIKIDFVESKMSSCNISFNLQLHCETVAKNFVGAMTLRADINLLRKKSEILSGISDEDIMDCLAEVTNQTLGVINYNLKKINIDARIGLPTILNSTTEYNMRSSFYLPICILSDANYGVSTKFYILYPFMKGNDLLETIEFDASLAQECEVEIF
jgi:hypothetical protein